MTERAWSRPITSAASAVEVAAKTGRRQEEPDAGVLGDEGDPVLWKAGSSGT